ncbi:MAG: winged helix-turn-helix domain-containing protein [Saprospiraceae bacterium]|nr:winged helix-turn-helix domain-containing protein [Saprospiraceae bacterium]
MCSNKDYLQIFILKLMLAHAPFRNYVNLDRLMVHLKLDVDIYKYLQYLIDLGLINKQRENSYMITDLGITIISNKDIHDVISDLSQQIYLEKDRVKEIIEKYNVV